MATTTLEITFLCDTRHYFRESYDMSVSGEAARSCRQRLIDARLRLLAKNFRIVATKLDGEAIQRLHRRGIGGDYQSPRLALLLRDDGYACHKQLRGVPKEIFDFAIGQLTSTGNDAFRQVNQVLTASGCVIVRRGEAVLIRNLRPHDWTLRTSKACKMATKKQVFSMVDADDAETMWRATKPRKKSVVAGQVDNLAAQLL